MVMGILFNFLILLPMFSYLQTKRNPELYKIDCDLKQPQQERKNNRSKNWKVRL